MLKIDNSIYNAYPGTKMGILIMKNVINSDSYKETDISDFLEEIRNKYTHITRQELKELAPINSYVSYYKNFGQSYHLLAQLESMLKGKSPNNAKTELLQAMFYSELEGMLLTAGHDLKKLRLPLQLKIADGTEMYQSISGKEVSTTHGDMILCDSNSTISSILHGPDYDSRITPETTDVLFSIYAPPGIDADYISMNLEKLEKRIRTFAINSKTELIQVFK
jgi:DNA/RNA-binding domain of Phe-tRNA-synthetase-like protein